MNDKVAQVAKTACTRTGNLGYTYEGEQNYAYLIEVSNERPTKKQSRAFG